MMRAVWREWKYYVGGLVWILCSGLLIGYAVAQITINVSGETRRGDLKQSQFYAIKLANLTTSSQSLSFGFVASKVSIVTPSGNSDEICVDYLQSAAAVCPAANTAGNDRIAAGTGNIWDQFTVKGVNVIAASGTQTVYVRAWN